MKGKLIYPKGGFWFRVKDMTQIADIEIYLQENFESGIIRALTICGKDVNGMRKFRLTSKSAIKTFLAHMNQSVGLDNFRIRVKKQKKKPTLEPQ